MVNEWKRTTIEHICIRVKNLDDDKNEKLSFPIQNAFFKIFKKK